MFRDQVEFLSCDDKHTIKVGEPNFPVAAVDKGKEVQWIRERRCSG